MIQRTCFYSIISTKRRIKIPIYEYKCSVCEHKFTKVAKMADRAVAVAEPCPNCKAEGTVNRHYGDDTHLEWSDPWQMGHKKPPSDWREFLSTLKKNTPGAADFRD